MTQARVDARAGRVLAGAGAWSFGLDCRSGAATLSLEGREVALRPLRWREKVTLARFAFMGPSFLDEQVLRLALAEGSEPLEGDEREAAVQLALWLNDPHGDTHGDTPGDTHRDTDPLGDTGTLPLQAPLLASVTLDVCAAMGVGPSALDDRDAVEVEGLWHAVGGHAAAVAARPRSLHSGSRPPGSAPVAPPASGDSVEVGDTTRIVIVPDPERASEPAAERDLPQLEEPVDDAPPLEEPEPDPAPRRGPAAAIASFRPVEYVPTDRPAEAPPAAHEPPAAGARDDGPALPELEAADSPEPAVSRLASERSTAARSRPHAPRPGAPAARPGAATAPPPAAAVRAPAAPRPVEAASRTSSGVSPPGPAAEPPVQAPALSHGDARLPAPVAHAAAFDADELLDELSERLALAASELGVSGA